jgi:hypothetical protein
MIEYVLKKPYTCDLGTLPEGSTIREVRGALYFNGGMVSPQYMDVLKTLIQNEEYVSKRKVIQNKI